MLNNFEEEILRMQGIERTQKTILSFTEGSTTDPPGTLAKDISDDLTSLLMTHPTSHQLLIILNVILSSSSCLPDPGPLNIPQPKLLQEALTGELASSIYTLLE